MRFASRRSNSGPSPTLCRGANGVDSICPEISRYAEPGGKAGFCAAPVTGTASDSAQPAAKASDPTSSRNVQGILCRKGVEACERFIDEKPLFDSGDRKSGIQLTRRIHNSQDSVCTRLLVTVYRNRERVHL